MIAQHVKADTLQPCRGARLGEGVLHVVALGQGLVVGEHHGVHVGGVGGQHALQAELGRAARVRQLVRVDVQQPVDAVRRRQLDALCARRDGF